MRQPSPSCMRLEACLLPAHSGALLIRGFMMDESDAILLGGISEAYLLLKRVNKRKKCRRSVWMKEYFKTRNFIILKDLEGNDNVLFKNFTRMSKNNFETLLNKVRPHTEKTDSRFREAIPAEVRLAITLRFLASGDSYASLMYLFRVSKQSISVIVPEVLKAIIGCLKECIQIPANAQQWKKVSNEIFLQWNYPNRIGALDGKHILILRPENTVAEFYNYKGTHSIVLMAIVDGNYNFIYVSIGCQGRISDGGVFRNTEFFKRLEDESLNIPSEEPLPGRNKPIPYVLVADDTFPLTRHIMKPFTTSLDKSSPRRVHNYRLSRARRLVENAFGLITSMFRIFRKPIEVKVDNTVSDIVLACVCLHNFLRSQSDSHRFYSPPGSFDNEDASTGQIIPGTWRQVTASDSGVSQLRRTPRNASNTAKAIREEFMEYFTSPAGCITRENNV